MKVFFPPICLIAFAAICFGQSRNIVKPDLSGTWELDSSRSSVAKFTSNWPEQIKITHYDSKLIIRQRVIVNGAPVERDLTYYTDGSGERNPTDWLTADPGSNHFKPSDAASKTTWNKDKIVIRSISRTYAGAAMVDLEVVDGFRLSSDGKTLTRTTRFVPRRVVTGDGEIGGGRAIDSKAVYKLISE